MLVSQQADYALRLLIDVARGEALGRAEVTREIAERQHIPRVFLTKIVAHLSSAGFLKTHRGKGGGVELGRPATDINVLQVIESFEGSLAFNECAHNPENCVISDDCGIRHLWMEAEGQLRYLFRSRTLADLIKIQDETQLVNLQNHFRSQSIQI
jgi:Rrf2 family protein